MASTPPEPAGAPDDRHPTGTEWLALRARADRADQLEAELTELRDSIRQDQIRDRRTGFAESHGIPAGLLHGDTEESWRDQADTLLGWRGEGNPERLAARRRISVENLQSGLSRASDGSNAKERAVHAMRNGQLRG